MRAPSFCFALAGMIALPLLSGAIAAPVDPADQARIEQDAVKAYVAKTAADAGTASDKLVAQHAPQLFNDAGSAVMGNPKGDVTIVEFFDYNCPFSRRVQARVEALLKSDPNVKLVLKEFTIEAPESSPIAARAALASVAQGKYEAYHDLMMRVTGHVLTVPEVFDDATAAGLDVDRLKKDMEAPAFYNQLIANFNLARALRIYQTPTFIIGGHIVTQASADIDFPKMVAEARAK